MLPLQQCMFHLDTKSINKKEKVVKVITIRIIAILLIRISIKKVKEKEKAVRVCGGQVQDFCMVLKTLSTWVPHVHGTLSRFSRLSSIINSNNSTNNSKIMLLNLLNPVLPHLQRRRKLCSLVFPKLFIIVTIVFPRKTVTMTTTISNSADFPVEKCMVKQVTLCMRSIIKILQKSRRWL